jgi:lysophosphatidic acid acyltransferase/lysophosphatidylinositol acyltransferase
MSSLLEQVKKSPIAHLLLTITFFTSGFILNILQALLYYFLRPINKYLFRKLNYYLCYSLYSQLVFMAEWWSGSDIIVYINKDDFYKYYGKEHGYLIMNHTYDIDWLIGWIFCERVGVLGNCKAYAKKSIQYLPTMGFAWKFSESVFLERNWDSDRLLIGRQVAELAQYPDPMFLLLFAEGTRFTEVKHQASIEFAKEKGLPILKRHLTPRTKGFTTSLPELRNRVPAIYSVQLAFDPKSNVKPTVMTLLLGKPVTGHMFFERIPVDSVPEDEEEAALWLRELYNKKDRMMDSFLTTGDWFATSGVPREDIIRLKRRPLSLLNMAGWAVVTLVPIGYYLVRLLTSGSTLYLSIGVCIILVFFFMLYKLINETKIDKGSSYGKTTPSTPEKSKNGSSHLKDQ